jgi:hypothetical protein
MDLFRRVQFQRLLFNYETVNENTLPLVEVWVNYNRTKRARFDVPREEEAALVRMLTKLQYKEQNLSFAAVVNEPAKNCALKFVELFIQ